MTPQKPNTQIGDRLRALREQRHITQDVLAAALGLKDRQSVAAIEAGERRIRPDEMVRAAELLGVDVEVILDPYRLLGEGEFNFRTKEADPAVVEEFEERAGRWIATYRELGRQIGIETRRLGLKLELTPRSSFEAAADSAESLWALWNLGDVPAGRLEEALDAAGILVLYVDASPAISGAASYLPGQHTILVNRRETEGRRSYDLAHELFHLMTWDAMPPKRVEAREPTGRKGNRVEQLADNFAAALLMPRRVITSRWEARGEVDLSRWIAQTAAEMRVSVPALRWRLLNLGLVSKAELEALPASHPGFRPREADDPRLFSRPFVARVADAVADGRLSLRRAATLLALEAKELLDLCTAYGRPLPYQPGSDVRFV